MIANVFSCPFIIRPPSDLLQRYPELKQAANSLALKYAFNELVTDDELRAIGQRLWQALAVDDAFGQARRKAGRQILPLVIESDDASVQQLPWETLCHPEHGFLGKSAAFTLFRSILGHAEENALTKAGPLRVLVTAAFTLFRSILGHVEENALTEAGPLRVLLFTSLPGDLNPETARLNVEEEQAQVQEALMPRIAAGVVTLEMPHDGRLSTLKKLLQGFQPHLLFLSGHGKFHHQPHTGEAPFGVFLFESEEGFSSNPVRETDLADAFIGSQVQCVILSACESGKTASDNLANGLTRQLSRMGIPHVIGMRESILDRAGTLFARQLCDSLAAKERIDVALQRARQAIIRPLRDSARRDQASDGLSELSLGQWCLPMLISTNAGLPLIDWNFTPRPPAQAVNQSLGSVTLPPIFLGRRAELRQLHERLHNGKLRQLLITGPGGQGKTSLAGKLAQDCQQQGYEALAWSARLENPCNDFIFELELQLTKENAEQYDRLRVSCDDEFSKARLLLKLRLGQTKNRIVLFFDNLESIQDPDTLELNDLRLRAWIEAAQSFVKQGLILLLTSRWQLPGWPDADHWELEHANYGDFLQMAIQSGLSENFLGNRDRLRRVYQTLHGNGRGLEFFVAASLDMNQAEEEAFLAQLEKASVETQADMSIDLIYRHLSDHERQLLQRLTVYHTPVPLEGVVKLALDLPESPQALLQRLSAVSLVERQYADEWQAYQYQCSPLVVQWLQKQGAPLPDRELFSAASEYQRYLFQHERQTLTQAIVVHRALQNADDQEAADRFALDYIVGSLSLRGVYRTLLDKWLPAIRQSVNLQIKAEALGQTGKQHHHLGAYDTALGYLKESLAIMQEIGDKSGEGAALNNISQIFQARGDYDTRTLGGRC